MTMQKNQTARITIDGISSDGSGVGRIDGQVIFVPGAAVGDELLVRIVKAGSRFSYGKIEQIEKASPHRIEPSCEASGRCGGCVFRHMSYQAELLAKQGFVQDAVRRIGRLEAECLPIVPSPLEDRYRNKAQYPVAAGGDGQLTYGFYAPRSHRVVECNDCKLQTERLNEIAQFIAQFLQQHKVLPYDERTQKGQVRHIYLRQSVYSGEVLVCIVVSRLPFKCGDALKEQLLAEFSDVESIVINHNPANTNVIVGKHSNVLHGSGAIEDSICGLPVQLGVHSFAQVNTRAAEGLFEIARRLAAPGKDDVLLDLYCGTGVIGLSMAADCGQLIGVEVVEAAVQAARRSADALGYSHASFYCESAAQAAKRMAGQGMKPDIIVLDPPRKGADAETLGAILDMAPQRIVMISCNPATMARDLAVLAKGGYSIQSVQPVDMFPRTRHVECVCHLERV